MMGDWKILDDSTTLEVLNNEVDKYIMERHFTGDGWCLTSDRGITILRMLQDHSCEYRYRLRPLESIRITKEIAQVLFKGIPGNHNGNFKTDRYTITEWMGRKVEIIE